MPTDKKNKIIEMIKDNVPLIIATAIIIISIAILLLARTGGLPLGFGNRGGGGSILSVTTSNLSNIWTDHPVFSGPAILHKIAIGQYSAGGQVGIFDSITGTDDSSIMFFATASSAQVWELDLQFDKGIMVTTTDQNHAMFFYTPLE